MTRLALGIAGLLAIVGGVSQASAQSVPWSGFYQVNNNAAVQVDKTVVTFPAGALTPASSVIAPLGVGFQNLSFSTSGTVFSNSYTYENAARTKGCIFTTLGIFNRRTARYSYTFSASALNSGGGAVPTCLHQPNSVNVTTGNFSATATMSGF
jgi:hypothetical protein